MSARSQHNLSNLVRSGERTKEGGATAAGRRCIAELLPQHADLLRARGYAPSTIRRYLDLLRDFDRYLERQGLDAAREDLRGVTREHAEGFVSELRKRRLSDSSRAQALQAVSRLFDDLCERGLLLVNPTAGIKRTTRRRKMRRVPTRAQVRRLLAAANTSLRTGIRDRALLEVLYGSALRVGELVDLTVHDVDLDHRLVRIEKTKSRRGRVVPLTAEAVQWLREYLTKVRPGWSKREPTERRLFLNNRSEPMSREVVRQSILRLCKQASLSRLSPHALRHAAATHMLAAGADIRHVQVLLGHKDLVTTQRYTRVLPAEVKATHARTHPRERAEDLTP